MKKGMILSVLLMVLVSGCSPTRLFLIDHNGVLTYNRNSGQLEIIWEWRERPNGVERDSVSSVKNDSINRILNYNVSKD